MVRDAPLGVLDWGVGGLGFVQALWRRRPGAALVYLSDSGAVPYGKLPRALLAARVASAIDELRARGAAHVVIACNAASSVADTLGDRSVTAISQAAIACVPRDLEGRLWVLGGVRTVRSQRYQRALRRDGLTVLGRVAQPLSAHVEAGVRDGSALERDFRRILAPIRDGDALLLACTHYPALHGHFAARLPLSSLFDPADALANEVVARDLANALGQSRFVTTGKSVAMADAARAAWGLALPAVSQISIPSGVAPRSRDATNGG